MSDAVCKDYAEITDLRASDPQADRARVADAAPPGPRSAATAG